MGSPLFALNEQGKVLRYAERETWGDLKIPVQEDLNSAGIESSLLFTNYAHDLVTDKYLEIVTTEDFNGVQCNFYNVNNDLYMTRSQISNALDYKNSDAIEVIHRRHKERLDQFSVTEKLTGTDGKRYNTYLYSQCGVFEICRWSQQPKADAFMDWVWDVIEAYRNGTLRNQLSKPQNDFSVLCMKVNGIENTLDNFYDRLNNLEEMAYYSKPDTTLTYIGIKQNPIIDPIRDTIEPLAKLYDDGSNGYNSTYRKVYEKMGCDWQYRRTRYQNKKGNKTKSY